MSSSTLALAPQSDAVVLDPRRVALDLSPFEPQDMGAMYKFAETICKTDFCPKDFRNNPDGAFVAMLYGRSLGIGSIASLQGIAVINGRPSTFGELFWAIIISHPDFVDCQEDSQDDGCTVVLTRRGQKPYTASFTKAEAQMANLLSKDGPWKTYPKGQYVWRARHRAATAKFSDALRGIMPREIALDYIEGEVVTTKPAPVATNAAPAPPTSGSQQKPVDENDPNRLVTNDEVSQWNKFLKTAGYTGVDKRALLDKFKIQRSGEMTLAMYRESERLAREEPKAAAASPATAEPALAAPEANPAETYVREQWTAKNVGMFDQNRIITANTKDGVTDWARIGMELDKETF